MRPRLRAAFVVTASLTGLTGCHKQGGGSGPSCEPEDCPPSASARIHTNNPPAMPIDASGTPAPKISPNVDGGSGR